MHTAWRKDINHAVDRMRPAMQSQPGESLDLLGDSRGELGA